MSHAKNKVNWYLRKAEKEVQEGKKHRGLIEKREDIEEARKHILKAEHNLKAISYFSEGDFSDWSMSAVFYCIYHCFLAIIEKFGYVRNVVKICISEHPKNPKNKLEGFFDESRNQECTIALIKHLKEQGKIDIDSRFIEALDVYDDKERHESSIIEKREAYTYGTTTSSDNEEEVIKALNLCKECLDKTKEIVFSQ